MYDNGGVTAGRYTVVFTGLFDAKKPGGYTYLIIGEDPLGSGDYTLYRGRPSYEKFGWGIDFLDLPEECQRLVLEVYLKLWGL